MVSGRFLPRLPACRCANRPNSTSLVLVGSRLRPNFASRRRNILFPRLAIPPSPLRDRVGYSDHVRFRGYFPVHLIPAYNLPVYASQWPLPDTTQDSVRGYSLGFTAAAISGDRDQRTCKAQLPHHRAYGSVRGGSRSCANTLEQGGQAQRFEVRIGEPGREGSTAGEIPRTAARRIAALPPCQLTSLPTRPQRWQPVGVALVALATKLFRIRRKHRLNGRSPSLSMANRKSCRDRHLE